MKYIVGSALMLAVCCLTGLAHEAPVQMRFSGNGTATSSVNPQQPDSTTGEENVDGTGTFGPFTFRNITAEANSPSASSTCTDASRVYFARLAGGDLFRFGDGSLLKVKLLEGGDCIDFVAGEGHCRLTLQVTGGTGRFGHATGMLTYTETATPVTFDSANTPVLFTEVGEITGVIDGITDCDEHEGALNK
jgi:hypothetical protein